MSESVRAGLLAKLRSGAHADVLLRFHLERAPEEQQLEQEQLGPEAEGANGSDVAGDLQFLGDALQAHKIILTLGSTCLEARLEGACWQGATAGAPPAAAQACSGCEQSQRDRRRELNNDSQQSSEDGQEGQKSAAVSAVPEVLVPLSSEGEEPFARQAIEYIYTGSLSADLGFEALLRLRQQACYLGVKDCPQACDQAMAYACNALYPQPGTSPDAASFQPVRSALAKQLVSHFGDAVAALTRPDLYRQLLQLPAVAVRELLAADDFGTDSEDSVFLMLAAWLDANEGEEGKEEGVPAATRAELCGLVRLHRLRPLYRNYVLPAYEPFDIGKVELGYVLRYVYAGEHERKNLLSFRSVRCGSPWYCSPARRQVVPEVGRTVEWSISREQLEQGLRERVESKDVTDVSACFGASAAEVGAGVGRHGTGVLADGGLWVVELQLDPATPDTAGICASFDFPPQLGRVQGVVELEGVELVVHKWTQGTQGTPGKRTVGWAGKFPTASAVQAGRGRGWVAALKLPPAAAASAAGAEGEGDSGVEAEVAAQVARWGEWLHDGKMTGSITFPRPRGS